MRYIAITIHLFLYLLLFIATGAQAQCPLPNDYFQPGEVLSYDLYYKYGIIYTKAGRSSLTVDEVTHQGESIYKMSLAAKSSGVVKKFFDMADTLSSYTTKELVPLFYTKDAHEDGAYTTERATYNYTSAGTTVRNINVRNGKLRYDTTFVAKECMYDMVNIIYYARTLDFSTMKKGDKTKVSFWTGRRHANMDIEYHGIEKITANDERKYNCVKLVLLTNDDVFDDKNEAMKVFITNDFNRIPIRIDSKLKVGSTRVILNAYKGQRH